jgi:hypothetical protein
MNARPSRIPFTPVRLKARHDGWTPERQYRFIAELAATRSIARACRAVRMSTVSAYKLRDRPDAASFAAAWQYALRDEPVHPHRPRRRAAARLRRLSEWRKVSEQNEMNGPPDSPTPPRASSQALQTLETLLAQLRAGAAG